MRLSTLHRVAPFCTITRSETNKAAATQLNDKRVIMGRAAPRTSHHEVPGSTSTIQALAKLS